MTRVSKEFGIACRYCILIGFDGVGGLGGRGTCGAFYCGVYVWFRCCCKEVCFVNPINKLPRYRNMKSLATRRCLSFLFMAVLTTTFPCLLRNPMSILYCPYYSLNTFSL